MPLPRGGCWRTAARGCGAAGAAVGGWCYAGRGGDAHAISHQQPGEGWHAGHSNVPYLSPSVWESRLRVLPDVQLHAGPVNDLLMMAIEWADIRPVHHDDDDLDVAGGRGPPQIMHTYGPQEGYRPFRVYGTASDPHGGINMTDQCSIYGSRKLETLVQKAAARQVAGLPQGTTFGDVFRIILKEGYNVYCYGGMIRDAFQNPDAVADDIDVLFTMPVQKLKKQCEARGWPVHIKKDESEGRTRCDVIAVGDKRAKMKFSGHRLDAGCAGDFQMNCLLYDIRNNCLIDPTHRGIQDAVWQRVTIPYPERQWDEWLNQDRLRGMTILRYYNFRSRGYWAGERTRHFMALRLYEMVQRGEADTAVRVFFQRKVVGKGPEKMATLKDVIISDIDVALGAGKGLETWGQVEKVTRSIIG